MWIIDHGWVVRETGCDNDDRMLREHCYNTRDEAIDARNHNLRVTLVYLSETSKLTLIDSLQEQDEKAQMALPHVIAELCKGLSSLKSEYEFDTTVIRAAVHYLEQLQHARVIPQPLPPKPDDHNQDALTLLLHFIGKHCNGDMLEHGLVIGSVQGRKCIHPENAKPNAQWHLHEKWSSHTRPDYIGPVEGVIGQITKT